MYLQEDGGMGGRIFLYSHVLILLLLINPLTLSAQGQPGQLQYSQQFRLGEGIIRIAEPGQLADSLNIWGDITSPGRYIVPRGTTLTDMMSFARGPVRLSTGETILDWSDIRLEVVISRLDINGKETKTEFVYFYKEPLPDNIRTFRLQNGDLVSVQVRRKPTWRDYLTVVAPTVSLVLSAVLLYDRATQKRN